MSQDLVEMGIIWRPFRREKNMIMTSLIWKVAITLTFAEVILCNLPSPPSPRAPPHTGIRLSAHAGSFPLEVLVCPYFPAFSIPGPTPMLFPDRIFLQTNFGKVNGCYQTSEATLSLLLNCAQDLRTSTFISAVAAT